MCNNIKYKESNTNNKLVKQINIIRSITSRMVMSGTPNVQRYTLHCNYKIKNMYIRTY